MSTVLLPAKVTDEPPTQRLPRIDAMEVEAADVVEDLPDLVEAD